MKFIYQKEVGLFKTKAMAHSLKAQDSILTKDIIFIIIIAIYMLLHFRVQNKLDLAYISMMMMDSEE
jgi:hypothetical protein